MEKFEKFGMILFYVCIVIMIFGLGISCYGQLQNSWHIMNNGMIVIGISMFVGILSTFVITRNN